MRATPPLSIHAWMRYDAIRQLLSGVCSGAVLEIGMGQGSVGVLLAQRYDYVGIDLDERAVATARARFGEFGVDPERIVHGGTESVRGRQFDLVCAFEVLEHCKDDRAALLDWRGLVKPEGAVLISVPANPSRFGKADQKAGHFRRYTRASMRRVLGEAGFGDVQILNYGFPTGYFLESVRNVAARRPLRRNLTTEERTLASGQWLQPTQSLAPVTRVLAAPPILAQRPFMTSDRGTGLVALARAA